MTRATEAEAAVIIADRPPRIDMVRANTTEATRLTIGSTPATIENEMTSGTRARVVTRPARTSRESNRGERRAVREVTGSASADVASTTAITSPKSRAQGPGYSTGRRATDVACGSATVTLNRPNVPLTIGDPDLWSIVNDCQP